ncbi:hypothetical protein BU26DRAFT_176931 [Trematosphaeria pertusa]|uniref:RING-type domain-containing protein n=1 Tax=Trematosphaeria pertusa TaxID=390896 RepID=A0A6A6HTL7_9PLEO|nr:uncharacterized protein BU26DRAFT_176931 [Trematosphaeria pertusa]KAF2241367.1 hypothetical protein BU26DRAFT_176931 [Trematosphaeria pertusa]
MAFSIRCCLDRIRKNTHQDGIPCERQPPQAHLSQVEILPRPTTHCRLHLGKSAAEVWLLYTESECPVCYEVPDTLVKLRCGHAFCDDCLPAWLLEKRQEETPTCLTCRMVLNCCNHNCCRLEIAHRVHKPERKPPVSTVALPIKRRVRSASETLRREMTQRRVQSKQEPPKKDRRGGKRQRANNAAAIESDDASDNTATKVGAFATFVDLTSPPPSPPSRANTAAMRLNVNGKRLRNDDFVSAQQFANRLLR